METTNSYFVDNHSDIGVFTQAKRDDMAEPQKSRGSVDPDKLKRLYAAGLNQVEIADTFGVSKQAVHQAIAKWDLHPNLNEYQANKANIFESKQALIVSSLTEEVINAANLQQRATAIGILEDKIRLERGQVTSINEIQIKALIASIDLSAIPEV